MAMQVAAEQAGFERARLTEQDLVSTLTRSLSELRAGLQKQHENDLDAISEEAVKVTNRLKAKLTTMELKNAQTEEYNSQLLALRVKDEAENIRIRQRLFQLESGVKGRDDLSIEIQQQNATDSARDVAQMASKMEGVKDRLKAEIDSLRLAEKEHKKAFQTAINERDYNMNERHKKYKSDIEKLEYQAKESSLILVRMSNDFKDSQESSSKKASSLVFELKRSLEKITNEKSFLEKELNSVKEQYVRFHCFDFCSFMKIVLYEITSFL